jgi:hypothetical protein
MLLGVAAVLGALGISAASASASEFEASGGTGATKGTGVIKQEEFKVWPMTVACTKAITKGSVPSPGKFETYEEEIKFSTCSTFGGGVKVTVTPEHVQYNANGTESLTEAVRITPAVLKCHYEIPAQSSVVGALTFGDELFFGNAKFPNGQQRLGLFTNWPGVTYTAVGWPCTGPKESTEFKEAKEVEEEGTEGKITAGIRDEVTGGNLTWIK